MIGWSEIRREPFRILFPAGVSFGIVGVSHWLFYALGWSRSASMFYHASIQMSSYMACFIAGFLWTALPRFAGADPASNKELVLLLLLLSTQVVLLSFGQWVGAEFCFAGLLLLLASFAVRRFVKRRSGFSPPAEFLWILIAILHGLIGIALLVFGQAHRGLPWSLIMGRSMAQQGFLISIVVGVGGFLAPRVMGRGFLPVDGADRFFLHAFMGALFCLSFWIEGRGALRAAYLLRAVIVSIEIFWTTKPHLLPKTPGLYTKLLWISLWMLMAGLWGAGLWPSLRVAMLHLVFLGSFSLMTFAVGTMVILSHAGQAPLLKKPLWALRIVGAGVLTAMVLRVISDFFPDYFFLLIGSAAAVWLVAALYWVIAMLPWVLKPAARDAFEQAHEQQKKILLR